MARYCAGGRAHAHLTALVSLGDLTGTTVYRQSRLCRDAVGSAATLEWHAVVDRAQKRLMLALGVIVAVIAAALIAGLSWLVMPAAIALVAPIWTSFITSLWLARRS